MSDSSDDEYPTSAPQQLADDRAESSEPQAHSGSPVQEESVSVPVTSNEADGEDGGEASAEASKPKFTFADVFGDDDDSDLSDEEDKAAPTRSNRRSASPSDSDDSDDNEDNYRPDGQTKPKKRRHSALDPDDDDDAKSPSRERSEPVPRRKSKSEGKKRAKKESRRETRTGSDGEQLEVEQEWDEATKRRRALDAKFDAVGKTGNKRRPKKMEGDDLMQDKQIEDITRLMLSAIYDDVKSNEQGRPAIKKTILLNKVMQVLQNASLQDALLENTEFLAAVTQYIEPLKDGALPSLTIQKSILGQLAKFEIIDKDILKSAGLGKIVNFYTRTKRVQPEITRQANLLIDKWSKPILRAAGIGTGTTVARMAATGHVEEERYNRQSGSGVVTINSKDVKKSELSQYASDLLETAEATKGKRPSTIGYSYTTAPPSRRIARSTAEQDKEDARQRQLDLQSTFRKKAMMASR